MRVRGQRFSLEDVESVWTSQDVPVPRALDLLSSLVDKSLVTKEDAKGGARYRLHETMREYSRLKLREAGEQDEVEGRCADYYVAICRQFAQQNRYRLLEWLEWMELEVDNIRSVLQRCLMRADFLRGLDLACSLGWYWATRATTEGVRWLDELLALAPSGGGNAAVSGRAHFIRGFLAVLQSDPAAARPALERGILGSRAAGNLPLLSHALSMASVAANMAGDHAAAERLLDESHAVTSSIDDVAATVSLLQARALNSMFGRRRGGPRRSDRRRASEPGVRRPLQSRNDADEPRRRHVHVR